MSCKVSAIVLHVVVGVCHRVSCMHVWLSPDRSACTDQRGCRIAISPYPRNHPWMCYLDLMYPDSTGYALLHSVTGGARASGPDVHTLPPLLLCCQTYLLRTADRAGAKHSHTAHCATTPARPQAAA